VYNIKVQSKEVKTQLVDCLLMLFLMERHVSAYSEAIIRFRLIYSIDSIIYGIY